MSDYPDRLLASPLERMLDERFCVESWRPEPHQQAPAGEWFGWLLFGGRFAGKTAAGAYYMTRHALGPPCFRSGAPHRMAIIAPTLDDAAYGCYKGPAGLEFHDPAAVMVGATGGTLIKWPNGAYAKLFGTDTEIATNRLRAGGNNCFVWADEIAAWRWLDLAWDNMLFGLRNGPHPHWVGCTTPKPRPLIKALAKGQDRKGQPIDVRVTHATSRDNPHVAEDVIARLEGSYLGTTFGEQELLGKIIDQERNALWQRAQIAKYRLTPEQAPRELLRRIIVGVDPSGGAGEQGIIVVGFTDRPLNHPEHRDPVLRGLVLADYTCTLPPDEWGDRAIQAAVDWDADGIVCESDYGRDMPLAVLAGAARRAGLMIPIKPALARAVGNKRARAFPVAAAAAQGRYPHVGHHELLEDQQCTWTEKENYSPDRIDAAVWPAWYTGLVTLSFTAAGALPAPGVMDRDLTRPGVDVAGQPVTPSTSSRSISPFQPPRRR